MDWGTVATSVAGGILGGGGLGALLGYRAALHQTDTAAKTAGALLDFEREKFMLEQGLAETERNRDPRFVRAETIRQCREFVKESWRINRLSFGFHELSLDEVASLLESVHTLLEQAIILQAQLETLGEWNLSVKNGKVCKSTAELMLAQANGAPKAEWHPTHDDHMSALNDFSAAVSEATRQDIDNIAKALDVEKKD